MGKIALPHFNVDHLPKVRIHKIRISNYKAFDEWTFDFQKNGEIGKFFSFIGGNGIGKSTVMEIIQLIFSNLKGYDVQRLKTLLSKSIRQTNGSNNVYSEDDFLIDATLSSNDEIYEISINKNGFTKSHPEEIQLYGSRICYLARFDKELKTFQLRRDQWDVFKCMFENVTGYEIEEMDDYRFGSYAELDNKQKTIMEDYILGFHVHKPHETILHRDCSDGERKVIKSFSTILNLEFAPQVILIDNVEMHVESGRHLPLIKSIQSCFPDSQIFTTTHSYHVSRGFSQRGQIHDLRIIRSEPIVKEQPWRLYIVDELRDLIVRLESLSIDDERCMSMSAKGNQLIHICLNENVQIDQFRLDIEKYMSECDRMFIKEIIK